MITEQGIDQAIYENVVIYVDPKVHTKNHLYNFNKILRCLIENIDNEKDGDWWQKLHKGDTIAKVYVPEDYHVQNNAGFWSYFRWYSALSIEQTSLLNKGDKWTQYYYSKWTLPTYRGDMALCFIETTQGHLIIGALPYDSK